MPVSEKKLIANRRNAQKSTGPKTPYGKLRSSRNAVKHGLYSNFNIYQVLLLLTQTFGDEFLLSLIPHLDSHIADPKILNRLRDLK